MAKDMLVLDGRSFLGNAPFVIWDCHTEGKGIFDGRFHFHDFYELSFIYEGEGSYSVNGQSAPVGKGFFLLTTPCDYHMLSVAEGKRLSYYNVIFRGSILAPAVSDAIYRLPSGLFFTIEGEEYDFFHKEFSRMLADYSAEQVDPIPPLSEVLVSGAINTLAARAVKRLQSNRAEAVPTEDSTVRRALIYLRENYRHKLTLKEVADAVGLSAGYFSSHFKKTVQIGFAEYLLHYRLLTAADYLASGDLPMKAVALMCGFPSYAYFSAAFNDYFGISPRDYRRGRA